ncbi:DUF3862 domain-containing protein [Enterococcus sp. BWR-S5]|uniref:DUF3862 domain-containing protein n=1 Tax=Enterococcus sp. BWR-S5 TaxID=2787714 RepID=UPI001920F1B8|nr:DUF3862 domain-containing protein [Enterococcus sp. BWR-S5]MBL1224286.1 DUF3862 domain-containing protein [Enterococcus sp. BWR-S5]
MGRKEDRQSMKTPITKKGWFWFLILLVLAGGGFAAVKLIPIPLDFNFGKAATQESSVTKESSENNITADDAAEIIENYKSIALGDPLVEDTKGVSYDDVVAILGEPSSNVDSEISGTTSKMVIWNNFNGAATISVTFKDDQATGKSISKIPVEEKKKKITTAQVDAIPFDGTYTYEQAVQYFGTPDSLSDSLINGVQAVTAMWATNMEQGVTFHFDDNIAISKEYTE